MHVSILLLFIIAFTAYLCGFFNTYKKADLAYNNLHDTTLIEFLTQHKTKKKDYTRIPKGFATYSKSLIGKRIKDTAVFRYEYPLVNHKRSIYETILHPPEISKQVDFYGVEDRFIIKTENGFRLNTTLPEHDFQKSMNKDGWFFNSFVDAGIDYAYLVKNYAHFSSDIAKQIYTDLSKNGDDSYFNRVQAALNFVQFIPYGRPDLDARGWYYHEIGVPPEVFIMGYGDCDSKSVFFASIIMNLIPVENIVLVECLVKSSNENTNGAHMMVAVSDLGISGEFVNFNNTDYLLLETTQPIAIGQFDWASFESTKIISLN